MLRPRRGGGGLGREDDDRSNGKDKGVPHVIRLQLWGIAALSALACFAAFVDPGPEAADRKGVAPVMEQSPEAVWNDTLADVKLFRSSGRLPTFGLTEGRYHYMADLKGYSGMRIKNLCGYDVANNTKPPQELLIPGRLAKGLPSSRTAPLHEQSLCFLWYTAHMWTRPMGGQKGLVLTRQGAGVDDKAFLVSALDSYQRHHSCAPWQVAPPTLFLNDTDQCSEFMTHNDRWAPLSSTLWFIKAADGSTGRHISLVRRSDIQSAVALGHLSCPISGAVASLEVPKVLLLDGHKFDNRIFVLVASFEPLVILLHHGHLRRSVFNYSDPFEQENRTLNASAYVFGHQMKRLRQGLQEAAQQMQHIQMRQAAAHAPRRPAAPPPTPPPLPPAPAFAWAGGSHPESDTDLARHVTNPRFGFAHTNQSDEVIQPLAALKRQVLAAGDARAWARLETSVRNAALHVTYAIKHKFFGREYNTRWGFMWLAMDVVYDSALNAHVVDINTGPDFYHHHAWPRWFLRERSIIAREAVDILQEVGFLKATKHTARTPLTPPEEWELLYHADQGGITRPGLLSPGACALKHSLN